MISPLVFTILQTVNVILGIIEFIVIAHVLTSWLVSFQVLNLRQPLVSQLWYLLQRVTEPIYRPIRRILPNMGGLDLSPMVVILVIFFLHQLMRNYVAHFAY
jgi:YggT family protein